MSDLELMAFAMGTGLQYLLAAPQQCYWEEYNRINPRLRLWEGRCMAAGILGLNDNKVGFRQGTSRDRLHGTSRSDQLTDIIGGDISQEVCPICTKQARPTDEPAFQPSPATQAPKLIDLLQMTEEEFREKFRGSPIKRAKWRGLLRNGAAALSVSDEPEAEATLEKLADHSEGLAG